MKILVKCLLRRVLTWVKKVGVRHEILVCNIETYDRGMDPALSGEEAQLPGDSNRQMVGIVFPLEMIN